MGYTRYQLEQSKVTTNAVQLFEALEAHRIHVHTVDGSMHWKHIAGRDYLYRCYSRGKNRSLGPRSPETEGHKAAFDEKKAAYKAREEALKAQLKIHAIYVRANRLHRFPLRLSRVIRSLQSGRVPFRIIGPCALYAYEARAGVLIAPEHLASERLDILLDARGGASKTQTKPQFLLSLLQRSDKTFQGLNDSESFFSAENSTGYRIVFCLEEGQRLGKIEFEHHLDTAASPCEALASLAWLGASPQFSAVVFDERGMPLRLETIDPRAFILHNWYASELLDHGVHSQHLDKTQALIVSRMLRCELTNLPITRTIARMFPQLLLRAASASLDDYDI